MAVVDKYITETALTLVFDQDFAPNAEIIVGVDNAEHYYTNSKNSKHDLLYNEPTVWGAKLEIELPSDAPALTVITVYVNTETLVTTFLNKYMLYKAQNRHLATKECSKWNMSVCKDCDEKRWRTETVVVLLRMQLLDYAYNNDLTEDTIQFFVDLTRVLNFDGITFESVPIFYNTL